jgi:hypothetical protein
VHRSPREDRKVRKRRAIEVTQLAFAACEASQEELAFGLGVSRTRFRAKPSHQPIGFHDVLGAPPIARRVFADELLESLGDRRVPCEASDPTVDDVTQLAQLIRALNDVMTHEAHAQADGFLSVADCEKGLREIADARRALDAREARLKRAMKERGAPVTSRANGQARSDAE